MKWFFLAHEATLSFRNAHRYHIHASNKIGLSRSNQMLHSWLFSAGHYYSTSTIKQADESSYRLMKHNTHERSIRMVDLEIISKDIIKPASPTPHNLKTFNLSIIDQVIHDCYTPLILFIPNANNSSVTDVITKRAKHLKDTLSEILTRFYPFAGEVKDYLHIECNDKGASYTVARVNETLEEFLCHPDDQKLRELRPESPHTAQSSIGNYIIGVQVNIFNCGGIGLCTSMSHKIFDGYTIFLFMKAWAAAARGSPETISPSFVASKIFPNNPHIKYSAPSKLMTTKPFTTKRFVFDSKALSSLKAQWVAGPSRGPTRTEATTTLIWKVAAKAASTVRPFGPQSHYALLSMVNLRNRASPPFPKESIGNIIDVTLSICYPWSQLHLPTMMGQVRESIEKINSDYIRSTKGEKLHETYDEILKNLNQLADMSEDGDILIATSVLNSGMYGLDFGWGKPVWFWYMNPGYQRIVALLDTRKGDGVEASVTLSPDEMKLFECDPELLSYAKVDTNPLVS